ncbi:MAG: InlB B-repeat-containing protein, partial [Prevotella sp.]|nr:InlB B-repeat-containing protein [Prevotella sp.]
MKHIKLLTMMAMALWASALSAQSHWQCDYAKFSESMAVFFQITDGDQVIADVTPYEVAAFVGEECRGVAQFVEEEVNDNTVKYGYLRIYSNGESNEKIALKVYNSTSQLEKRLAVSSFLFEKDLRIGVPSSPVKYDIAANVPKYQLTLTPQDALMGTAEGSGIFEENDFAHISATANTGYHFVKWSDENTDAERTIEITAKTDLVAIFAPNQHLLTFISEGDTVRAAQQDYNSTIVPPEAPLKEGYSFTGWKPAIAEKMPNNPLTYEAQFQINEYTMTFVVDGQKVREAVLEYGKPVPTPSVPAKTGFTFAGWEPAVPATVPGRDVTFTAQWERNKYVAFFIADGDTIKSDSILYEAAIEKPADPTKTGYTFTGWTPEVLATMP